MRHGLNARTVPLILLTSLTLLLGVSPSPAQEATPVDAAREAVAQDPDDAQAHMRLARELTAAIQADPMTKGQLYSLDLVRTLERTIELDPTMVEAYQYLVGFYLNAPPIAGGSIERARETASKLTEHDAEAGEALLQMVEQRSSGPSQGAARQH